MPPRQRVTYKSGIEWRLYVPMTSTVGLFSFVIAIVCATMLKNFKDPSKGNACWLSSGEATNTNPNNENSNSSPEFFELLIKLTLSCASMYTIIALLAFWRYIYEFVKFCMHVTNVYYMSLVMYITIVLTTENGIACCNVNQGSPSANTPFGDYKPPLHQCAFFGGFAMVSWSIGCVALIAGCYACRLFPRKSTKKPKNKRTKAEIERIKRKKKEWLKKREEAKRQQEEAMRADEEQNNQGDDIGIGFEENN